MNLLIIGNGFDLAHGLPTSYTDFLKFVNEANDYYNNFYPKYKDVTKKDKEGKEFFDYFIELNKNDDFEYITELCKLSSTNLWFKYFNNISNKTNTWIDFEKEIARFVRILDSLKEEKDFAMTYNRVDFHVPAVLQSFFKIVDLEKTIYKGQYSNNEVFFTLSLYNYFSLANKLSTDLNGLTRCLEIYLSKYINNLDKGLRIPEILALRNDIDYVLSFNYTNTFERFYGRPNVEYDYIHGKANIENTIETCQLVLGIDEYLDEEERNKNIDFIQYKKYFQRIYKKTGCKYKDWLKKIDTHNRTNGFYTGMKELNIHIIGHSLDITDKDILNELIMFDKQNKQDKQKGLRNVIVPVKVIIYDHNKKANASHIANLVRVITQEELIKGVYGKDGKDPKIVFKHQNESITLYHHITQAAHNDYLDEPGEKENIQSDLDEMDSWDNEE